MGIHRRLPLSRHAGLRAHLHGILQNQMHTKKRIQPSGSCGSAHTGAIKHSHYVPAGFDPVLLVDGNRGWRLVV